MELKDYATALDVSDSSPWTTDLDLTYAGVPSFTMDASKIFLGSSDEIESIHKKIEKLNERQEKNDQHVDELEADIDYLNNEQEKASQQHEALINDLYNKHTTVLNNHTELVCRVSTDENHINFLEEKIDSLTNEIDNLKMQMAVLQQAIQSKR